MKKYFLACLLLGGLTTASVAQRTPQPSPAASMKQTVGVTDFTVSYSRPSLKDRAVFGTNTPLAPTGSVWRTGANAASTIESTTDFTFGGTKVPAGKYAIFSIPQSGAWTVILNKNYQGGIGAYKEADDVARVQVSPASGPKNETFSITMSDLTDSTAVLNLAWGTTHVPVQLGVATTELTFQGLKKAVAEKPEDAGTLQAAATYMLTKNKDLDQALAYTDKAIGLKESFNNLWLKAQILGKLGKVADAVKVGERALAVGEASGNDAFKSFYKGQIESGLSDLKSKLPAVPATPSKKKKK